MGRAVVVSPEVLRPYLPEDWYGPNGEKFSVDLIPRENCGTILCVEVRGSPLATPESSLWAAHTEIGDDLTLIRPNAYQQYVDRTIKNLEQAYLAMFMKESRLEATKRRRRNYHAEVLDK